MSFRTIFQGVITQLSEQISTLNERMDEFTSRMEELNSKFLERKVSASQQNLAEATGNGSASTSLFVTGLANGSRLPNSSSSSQLGKDSSFMEEVNPHLDLLLLNYWHSYEKDHVLYMQK